MTERTLTLADIKYSNTFSGIQITESQHAVTLTEDWSKVRSPGRARRRLLQGHRQRIAVVETPCAVTLANGDVIMHPAVYAKLKQEIGAAMRRKGDLLFADAIFGSNFFQ